MFYYCSSQHCLRLAKRNVCTAKPVEKFLDKHSDTCPDCGYTLYVVKEDKPPRRAQAESSRNYAKKYA